MTISDMGYTKEVMAIIKESYQRGKLDATYENGIRIEKNQFENGYRMGRADAIEEFVKTIVKSIKNDVMYEQSTGGIGIACTLDGKEMRQTSEYIIDLINCFAEQLKEQKNENTNEKKTE